MSKKTNTNANPTTSIPNLVVSRIYASVHEESNSASIDLLAKLVSQTNKNGVPAIATRGGQQELRSYFLGAFVPHYKEAYSQADAGTFFVDCGNGVLVPVDTKRVRNAKDWIMETLRKEADSHGYSVSINMRGKEVDSWKLTISKNPVPEKEVPTAADASASHSEGEGDSHEINAGNVNEVLERAIDTILKLDSNSRVYAIARLVDSLDADAQKEQVSRSRELGLDFDSQDLLSQQAAFAKAYLEAVNSQEA